MKKTAPFIIFLLVALPSFAQKIKYTDAFVQKLEQVQLDLYTPTEGKYKSKRPPKNDYQAIDHLIFSKKEQLEIRYTIIPFSILDKRTQIPNIDFMRVVSSVATNDDREDAIISLHNLEEADLREHFNADWGSIAYFQPKAKFSSWKYCRMLGLYAEGRGMVYVFFLYDEPSVHLDNRLQALRFNVKL